MLQKEIGKTLYEELKELIDKTEKSHLMTKLKEYARNLDVRNRTEFENHLVKFSQENEYENIRTIFYEALASLTSVWAVDRPKKKLFMWRCLMRL